MTCMYCKYLKTVEGSRDFHGLQLEPDDYECMADPTEDEIDKYFCDGEDGAENCSCFKRGDYL